MKQMSKIRPAQRVISMLFVLMLLPLNLLFAQQTGSTASSSSQYPVLSEKPALTTTAVTNWDMQVLQEFLMNWRAEGGMSTSTKLVAFAQRLGDRLNTNNSALEQLRSLYRIQQEQLDHLKRQSRPIFALITDPSNPLYAFSIISAPTFPPFPPITTTSYSHRVGVGASVTQQLPTAGSLSLSVKQGSVASLPENATAWTWEHKPSLSVSFQQPLWLGDGFIDSSYAKKSLEKQLLGQTGTLETIGQTKNQLVLQGSRLLVLRQNLMEGRWLASQQAHIVEQELLDARRDLEAGRTSTSQLARQIYARDQLLLQIADLDKEITALQNSLISLWGAEDVSSLPLYVDIDMDNTLWLAAYSGQGLVNNNSIMQRMLQDFPAYRDALRDLQVAQIETSMGNPADAPFFSLALQLSPFYTATSGATLWGSAQELFSNGKPVFSVSVSFVATDLGRSLSRLTGALSRESIYQAEKSMQIAQEALLSKVEELQRQLNRQMLSLQLYLSDYEIASNDVEVERIRSSIGLADSISIQRKEIQRYASAFFVLQSLREMELIYLEMQIMTENGFLIK